MNREYKVRWEINVDAENPFEAARLAREIQLDHTNIANVFDVSNEGLTERIDLNQQTVKTLPQRPEPTAKILAVLEHAVDKFDAENNDGDNEASFSYDDLAAAQEFICAWEGVAQ